MLPALRGSERRELSWLAERSRAQRLRTMREFAEEEVVIPDGPFEGRRFQCSRQPYSGLWFDAVDSGRWNRFVATGPTQSGKSLTCFIIPTLYHLFEVGETVICGIPHMDMASDKWREDLRPAIERSRYRNLLPRRGGGSRGGRVDAIRFTNGATLKFMSGGGGDKSRAAFTSRVLVVTETDGMDEASDGSREADKITQLEARTLAYGSRKRIYMECTVSIEQGRTWRELEAGTRSRIVLPCPHCGEHVFLERDELVGWKDAANVVAARGEAAWYCTACGLRWSEEDRRGANARGALLHREQRIDAEGMVTGAGPETDTLGFRWSAINNLFASAGDVGGREWVAGQAIDEENSEKAMRQFVWALPYEPAVTDTAPLMAQTLQRRQGPDGRGVIPKGAVHVTIGADVGKFFLHWLAVAWLGDGSGRVFDYGVVGLHSEELGVERAVQAGLREMRELFEARDWGASQMWIDSGFQKDVVYPFCRESGGKSYRPTKGLGSSQTQNRQRYTRPKTTGAVVRMIGEDFHICRLKGGARTMLVEVDVDAWKTKVHNRLASPGGESGSILLFQADPKDHLALSRHLTAERHRLEFVAGKGDVPRWDRIRQANHWLDCLVLAAAAGSYCGVRVVEAAKREVAAEPAAGSRRAPRAPRSSAQSAYRRH